MTANQIANASLNEAIRHDIVSEEEIKRHNSSLENLEYDRLQLNQYVETTRLDLQQRYNEAVIANEQEALNIKQQQQDLEEYYKTQMVALSVREQDIKEEWNKVQESLGLINAGLKNKEIEYQKHQWDEANAISHEDLDIRRTYNENQIELGLANVQIKQQELSLAQNNFDLNYLKAQQSYNLGLQNVTLGNQQLQFEMSKWDSQKELLQSQIYNNYVGATTSGLRNLFTSGESLFNLVF